MASAVLLVVGAVPVEVALFGALAGVAGLAVGEAVRRGYGARQPRNPL